VSFVLPIELTVRIMLSLLVGSLAWSAFRFRERVLYDTWSIGEEHRVDIM